MRSTSPNVCGPHRAAMMNRKIQLVVAMPERQIPQHNGRGPLGKERDRVTDLADCQCILPQTAGNSRFVILLCNELQSARLNPLISVHQYCITDRSREERHYCALCYAQRGK
jgi:hypothetical protein